MILYMRDFQEQGAIVDYSTRNVSFIKIALIYEKMGIKNNKFMLSLYDTTLIGVDPHSTELTEDQMLRVALECKRNYWYYIREVARVPAGGENGITFEANRANIAHAWVMLNAMDSFLTMPRQIGKTVGTLTFYTWLLYIAGAHMRVGLFAKDAKLRTENVGTIKEIRDLLPKYLLHMTSDDMNNQEGLVYAELKTKYLTFVAQSDVKSAMAQGRGQSLVSQHWDEIVYYVNNNLSFPSALAASDTAQAQAKRAGLPVSHIITTTAGDIDSPAGSYAYSIKNQCLRFSEKFFDMDNREEVDNTLAAAEGYRFYLEYSYQQLGKDEKWFQWVCRNKDRRTIEKDYLNLWQFGAGKDSLVPKDQLDRLGASVRPPDIIDTSLGLMIRWFITLEQFNDPEFMRQLFIIGTDTSDNAGKDFTSFVIRDPFTLAVIATFRTNQTNFFQVCQMIVALLLKLPNSIWIPERNKNGAVMIDTVLDLMKEHPSFRPLQRIYNTLYQKYDTDPVAIDNVDMSQGSWRKHLGFDTTAGSREQLFKSVMSTLLQMGADRTHDGDLVDEYRSLILKNGKIDHPAGGHNDLVISDLLCGWFIFQGKNHHLYGIELGSLLSGVGSDGQPADPLTKQQMDQHRGRVADIRRQLTFNSNPVVRMALERERKHLQSILGTEEEEPTVSQAQVQATVVEKRPGLDMSGAAKWMSYAF